MKYLIALFFVFLIKVSSAQSSVVDSLANTVCRCVQEHNTLNDSSIINFCFSNAAQQMVKVLPKSKSKLEKVIEAAYFNLQKTCSSFMSLIEKSTPKKSDWEMIDSNLPTKLDSMQCSEIANYKTLYYLEADGDTTHCSIGNGYWIDSFKGGKYYSKCTLKWTSPCDFDVEFLKSDYPPRMKLNKKGEKFAYRLIDKTDNYYLATAHYGTLWCKFKIYYK